MTEKGSERGAGGKTIRVQYYHAAEKDAKEDQRLVKRLGFKEVNQTLALPDQPEIRQVVAAVPHLLRIIE